MHPYDRWLSIHPDDDLPGWVFDYATCSVCDKANDLDDEDAAEYGIEMCDCKYCERCEKDRLSGDFYWGLSELEKEIVDRRSGLETTVPPNEDCIICDTCIEELLDEEDAEKI